MILQLFGGYAFMLQTRGSVDRALKKQHQTGLGLPDAAEPQLLTHRAAKAMASRMSSFAPSSEGHR
jgi:hypothetical protein